MLVPDTVSIGRFMWWAPWSVTRPLRPRRFHGCDEWLNPSVAIVLPLVGCFIWFHGKDFDRSGEPPEPTNVPGCPALYHGKRGDQECICPSTGTTRRSNGE